jgi:hypothetical protein
MKLLKGTLILILLLAFFVSDKVFAQTPLTVAIFSRNKTRDASYDKYVDMFQAGLITQLTGKYKIIDKDDVISTFKKETKKEENKGFKITDFFPFLDVIGQMTQAAKKPEENKPVLEKESYLRIAQSIGANYFLIADLEEVVTNNIKETVYGNQINDVNITADLSVKILDAAKGGSVMADSVRVEKRLHGDEKTTFTQDDVMQALPVLMKNAAAEVSKKFLGTIDKIQVAEGGTPNAVQVNFTVKTNVPGVTVELDSATIGTAPGTFQVVTGAHRIRLSKDGYSAFERDVNVFDKAEFSVSLEKTGEGQDAKSKQDKADADNKW